MSSIIKGILSAILQFFYECWNTPKRDIPVGGSKHSDPVRSAIRLRKNSKPRRTP